MIGTRYILTISRGSKLVKLGLLKCQQINGQRGLTCQMNYHTNTLLFTIFEELKGGE